MTGFVFFIVEDLLSYISLANLIGCESVSKLENDLAYACKMRLKTLIIRRYSAKG